MNFLLFLIYSFAYLIGLGSLIATVFGVSPFVCFSFETKEVFLNPFEDWLTLFNRFEYGQWSIDSAHNFMIFLCFIFFFPLWILLWFLIRRIKFIRLLKSPLHYIKKKKFSNSALPAPAKNGLVERPKALPKGLSFGMPIPEVAASKTESTLDEAVNNDTNYSQAKEMLTEEFKDEIRNLGKQYGFDMFENVRLEKYLVPLVLATDTKALLLTFLLEKREWIADEEVAENGTEPTWFSAEGLVTSPFFEMSQAALILKEKEPDSEIIPVVVLANGTILNADTMQETWKAANGRVATYGQDVADDRLVSLENLLIRENPPTEEVAL